jgi:hypothetical protein
LSIEEHVHRLVPAVFVNRRQIFEELRLRS